ncbi:MAG: hypothetical protein U9N53_05280, partial [Bacteroidota bacterium]|nr:hypothetical protein [Bacteroidota bacterium]
MIFVYDKPVDFEYIFLTIDCDIIYRFTSKIYISDFQPYFCYIYKTIGLRPMLIQVALSELYNS